MNRSDVIRGADDRFHVIINQTGWTISFASEGDARDVSDVINASYLDGREHAREEIRNALGIED